MENKEQQPSRGENILEVIRISVFAILLIFAFYLTVKLSYDQGRRDARLLQVEKNISEVEETLLILKSVQADLSRDFRALEEDYRSEFYYPYE